VHELGDWEIDCLSNDRLFDELDALVLRLASGYSHFHNGTLERLTIVQPEQIVEAVQKDGSPAGVEKLSAMTLKRKLFNSAADHGMQKQRE